MKVRKVFVAREVIDVYNTHVARLRVHDNYPPETADTRGKKGTGGMRARRRT